MASESGPSHDDWKNMNEMIEKKRAQNRIAQRNYRRNVKRRIEELEQQVAAQAKLLALGGEAGKLWQAGVSSFQTGEATPNMFGDTDRPARGEQQDENAPLPTPVSEPFGAHEESGAGTDKHRQSAEISPNMDRPESPMSPFADLNMGMLDGIHLLHTPNEPFPISEGRSQRQNSTSSWCGFDHSSLHSSSSASDDLAPPVTGDAAFEPTMEGRIEYLIRCAQKAGFPDLDSAMIAFYTSPFDEGSGCSITQHLSRKRCLPKLLAALRSHAESWRSWEAHAYQDEILKSAESLLLAEMRSTLALGADKLLLPASASNSRDCNWSAVSHQVRDEVSNMACPGLGAANYS
ncbi:hypothetical protein G6011_02569 [Neofusicoccum parvum]|uniref:Uncharacterized protein n=1 Tax=Neofusicoccum parvum TaxID=310453 RepID=A0ACB5SAY9_9PEZI|nr:hypothetical protein G6011_02569 [Neofusicoccum parvum]